ncbi:MAG: hypothetical protein JNJ90_17510 [Saprospiraceae bacterium]|jgi:hypothetical protein|nr:hypothetical protein [Saprospiraceae bacterium]
MKQITLSLLILFASTALHATCFPLLYADGKTACERREFNTALKRLEAARGCPDKPAVTDLEDWIARARRGRDERTAWKRALESDSRTGWEVFLSRFPDGYYRARAEERLDKCKEQERKPIVQQTPIGAVDWTTDMVQATGEAIINRQKWPLEAQAVLMAKRGAEAVARANLLETIAGVHIRRTTTVRDLMTESDEVQTYVSGLVRGARIAGEPQVDKDVVRVTMQVPVFGPGGVASVLLAPQPGPFADSSDTPDADPLEWTLLLPPGTVPTFALFPVFADPKGALLFDGATLNGAEEAPLARWSKAASGEYFTGTDAYESALDEQGRLVLPDAALPVFQKWLAQRKSGGGAPPVRVVLK